MKKKKIQELQKDIYCCALLLMEDEPKEALFLCPYVLGTGTPFDHRTSPSDAHTPPQASRTLCSALRQRDKAFRSTEMV